MASIQPIKSMITFEQKQTELGNYYPACLLADEHLYEGLEVCFTISKSVLSDSENQEDLEVIENMLIGLSQYKVWRNENINTPKTIESHFCLLPQQTSHLHFEYVPFSDVPTDVIFFSHEEITGISRVLNKANERLKNMIVEADPDSIDNLTEMNNKVESLSISFNSFLDSWNKYKDETNNEFQINN